MMTSAPAVADTLSKAEVATRVAAISAALQAAGSEQRRQVAVGYFPTAMRVWGVPVPQIRTIARQQVASLRGTPAASVVALARAVIDEGSMEARQVAYEILAAHKPALTALDEATIEALGRGIDNWASVDCFAVLIAGAAWQKGRVRDATIARWAASPDRFWRRAALVCTVPLNMRSRGGKGDVTRTLAVCRQLRADGDDMVVKAMSWALRELIPHDSAAVEQFMADHESTLNRRILRETRNKLRTGKKNPSA